MDVERYAELSEKVDLAGLDWTLARRVGLSEDERFILTYFSDIESQTIVYLRDLLKTKDALAPDVMAFLSIWNYEEFFHGRALARLLAECGHPLLERCTERVRAQARLSERLEALGGALLSRLFRDQFPALYMTWGALNELTTLRGYERIIETTANPVLAELCRRIAKQERRHFAWYYNSARERLLASRSAQRLTRLILRWFWSPVGAGVKSEAEVARLLRTLFPGPAAAGLAAAVDAKMAALPGLAGLTLMGRYFGRLRPTRAPAPLREAQAA